MNRRKTVVTLVLLALFAALSIVLGKFLQIPVGDSIRISFENTPIILAGFLFGPWAGMATGIVADLLGSVMRGYDINPIITAGAACVGLMSGIAFRLTKKPRKYFGLLLAILPAHIVGSMIVKSVGLYLVYSTPIPVLLIRIPVYLAIGALESYVIYLLLKSHVFDSYLFNNEGQKK